MNICFSVDDSIYRFGGVQYNVLTLAKWCADQGHTVTILHSPNPSVKGFTLPDGITVIPVAQGFDIKGLSFNGSVSPFPGFGSKKEIKKLLLEKQFDVIYFNYPFSPFVSSIVAKTAKKLRKKGLVKTKLIATVLIYVEENLIPRLGNKGLALINRRAIKSLDVVTHCSDAAKEYVRNYLNSESVFVPLSTDDNQIGDKLLRPVSEKLSVLFFGRLELRKGVLDFIEALNKVPRHLLDTADITIAGGAGVLEKEAKALVTQYKLPVTFKLNVPDAEKRECFRKADIAVFPAKYGESFGIVLVEAMSYGCAVLGYANAGYAFTMGGFKEETLANVNDIATLSMKLTELLQHPEQAQNLGKRLKEYFLKNYSVDVVGKRMLELAQ
jgi:phosphatidylinositol alpha-mannosyltransferase